MLKIFRRKEDSRKDDYQDMKKLDTLLDDYNSLALENISSKMQQLKELQMNI